MKNLLKKQEQQERQYLSDDSCDNIIISNINDDELIRQVEAVNVSSECLEPTADPVLKEEGIDNTLLQSTDQITVKTETIIKIETITTSSHRKKSKSKESKQKSNPAKNLNAMDGDYDDVTKVSYVSC